jgi:hypothetical protein
MAPREGRLREPVQQEDERAVVRTFGPRVEHEVSDRELHTHDAHATQERLHTA